MTAKSIAYFLGYPISGVAAGMLWGCLISHLPARWEIPALVASNLALVVVALVLALRMGRACKALQAEQDQLALAVTLLEHLRRRRSNERI